jgi:hypothetical protein
LEVENTRIGKKLRNMFVMASVAIVVSLPTIVYLGTVAAAGRVVPNYCNNAGGCPHGHNNYPVQKLKGALPIF